MIKVKKIKDKSTESPEITEEDNSHNCPTCKFSIKNSKDLKLHKLYKCSNCSNNFFIIKQPRRILCYGLKENKLLVQYKVKETREKLKKFYKEKKKESGLLGRKIDNIVQELHSLNKLKPEDRQKLKDHEEKLIKSLQDLQTEKRFKQEFPKFSVFRSFVKKNKLKPSDLE